MKKTISSARGRTFSPGASAPSCGEEGQATPIDEDSFLRYYQTVIRAASMEGPPPLLGDRVIPPVDGTHTSVVEVVFGDSPLSRMKIALKNQLGEEGEMGKFASTWTRIQALVRMIGDGSLKHWAISRPREPKHLYYPDAVVLAAAISPLNDEHTFQIDGFDRLVRERLGGINCGHIVGWA
jgi:hypothetical protein